MTQVQKELRWRQPEFHHPTLPKPISSSYPATQIAKAPFLRTLFDMFNLTGFWKITCSFGFWPTPKLSFRRVVQRPPWRWQGSHCVRETFRNFPSTPENPPTFCIHRRWDDGVWRLDIKAKKTSECWDAINCKLLEQNTIADGQGKKTEPPKPFIMLEASKYVAFFLARGTWKIQLCGTKFNRVMFDLPEIRKPFALSGIKLYN